MSRKNLSKREVAAAKTENDPLAYYRLLLWLAFGVNALAFWWQCVDRYLAPRFLFLSVSLFVCLVLLWRDLQKNADWRLHTFDLLLLTWYGWNVASVFWAFSWSEAVFYTQKVSLLFLVYWLLRQTLLRSETTARRVLFQATVLLTWVVCGILIVQLIIAFTRNGLENQALYDYASAVYGNKSLATEFLFFLLIFNVFFYREYVRKWLFYSTVSLLFLLIVVLQTRTVYLAVVAGALVYFPARAWLDAAFRPVFFKKILPLGVVSVMLLVAVVALKGRGNSLTERLNPATYLESVSANERRFVWYKTDVLNRDHFWLGVGNGSWKFWFPSKNIEGGYRLQEQNVIFTRAHNDYLEIRSELGVIGILLFSALFLLALLIAVRVVQKTVDVERRHDVLILAVGLLGYCIIQYFDFPRERIEMQVILAVFFAWLTYLGGNVLERLPGVNVQTSSRLFSGFWAAALLFNILIGWYRVTGEIHAMRTLTAQGRSDYPTIVREARLARNMFNEYNDVAIPLQWHEGVGLYFLDQMGPCVTAFGEAYRLNPWSFQVLNNYASALLKQGDIQRAIPILEQTVGINPRFDEGKLNLSYAYLQLNNYPKALEWAQRIDTIANPQTEDARSKNRETLRQQSLFLKEIQNSMSSGKK